MRRMTSIFLTFVLVGLSVFPLYTKTIIAEAEESAIQSFIDETVELIKENDADKMFVAENEERIETASYDFSDTESENITFQTCRLIVQAKNEIEKLNSIGIANGFLDYNIVQFASTEDAEKAYQHYLSCNYVISVSPERVYKPEKDYVVGDDKYITYENGTPERLDFWGSKVTE